MEFFYLTLHENIVSYANPYIFGKCNLARSARLWVEMAYLCQIWRWLQQLPANFWSHPQLPGSPPPTSHSGRLGWFFCCCRLLPCNHCSNWTWVLEEISAYGSKLRSTHCRELTVSWIWIRNSFFFFKIGRSGSVNFF